MKIDMATIVVLTRDTDPINRREYEKRSDALIELANEILDRLDFRSLIESKMTEAEKLVMKFDVETTVDM